MPQISGFSVGAAAGRQQACADLKVDLKPGGLKVDGEEGSQRRAALILCISIQLWELET